MAEQTPATNWKLEAWVYFKFLTDGFGAKLKGVVVDTDTDAGGKNHATVLKPDHTTVRVLSDHLEPRTV